MRKLCHPRIVSLIEEQDSPEWLFLVMELVSGMYIIFSILAVSVCEFVTSIVKIIESPSCSLCILLFMSAIPLL